MLMLMCPAASDGLCSVSVVVEIQSVVVVVVVVVVYLDGHDGNPNSSVSQQTWANSRNLVVSDYIVWRIRNVNLFIRLMMMIKKVL